MNLRYFQPHCTYATVTVTVTVTAAMLVGWVTGEDIVALVVAEKTDGVVAALYH